jgi:hypothetical protein
MLTIPYFLLKRPGVGTLTSLDTLFSYFISRRYDSEDVIRTSELFTQYNNNE